MRVANIWIMRLFLSHKNTHSIMYSFMPMQKRINKLEKKEYDAEEWHGIQQDNKGKSHNKTELNRSERESQSRDMKFMYCNRAKWDNDNKCSAEQKSIDNIMLRFFSVRIHVPQIATNLCTATEICVQQQKQTKRKKKLLSHFSPMANSMVMRINEWKRRSENEYKKKIRHKCKYK